MKKDDMHINDDDIKNFKAFIKTDRFQNGLRSLEKWVWYGTQCIRAKQAFARNKWVKELNSLLLLAEDDILKADRAASIKLAEIDKNRLVKWYQDTNRFCVSPRTILKEFNKTDKPDKTEYEKILNTLELLEKQLQSYSLTENEKMVVVDIITAISKIEITVKEKAKKAKKAA